MMNWFKKIFLTEEIKAFKAKGDLKISDQKLSKEQGEGYEALGIDIGTSGLTSFNTFYNTFLNKQLTTNKDRISKYRNMSSMPEISDVIEDAVNESTQENDDGNVFTLHILDEKMAKNENISNTLNQEFKELMFDQLDMNTGIWDLFYNYMIDGRLYFERIINISHHKEGIKSIKKLPADTMDYFYNYQTGRIDAYVQYLRKGTKKPKTIEEAKLDANIITFIPEQISFIPYRYGMNKNDVYGFLENCKIAYNQLKLLEASVIIYRLVRAPERFVFKIDVGNMPRDKALAYVNKIKKQMNRKQTYDPETGVLEGTNNVACIRHNTKIKLLDGRNLSLTDIINEYNDGKVNWVYSINQKTHRMEPNKIINAVITRKNEQLIRIHLDDGAYFDTTHDHKWIMRDGSEIRADELKVDDSLMPLYTKERNMYSGKNKQYYEYTLDLKNNRWSTTHKLVCEQTQRKRKPGECIHHINFKSLNNEPTNLKLMGTLEHREYHGKHTRERWANFTKEEYDRECKKRHDGWMERMKDPVKAKETRDHTIYWNKKLNKVKKLQEGLNLPHNREHQRKQASKYSKEYWSDPKHIKEASDIKTVEVDFTVCDMFIKFFVKSGYPKRDDLFKLINSDGALMKYWKSINEHKTHQNTKLKSITRPLMNKIFNWMGVTDYPHLREICNSMPAVVNHKVAKIEYLEERDDTGCITVENNHNFAVTFELPNGSKSQVYVRNSILDNIFIPQTDNRGSDVDSIGGNATGFTELDDIHYFSKKLYRSLKYPISRIENKNEGNAGDNLFRGTGFAEITRDEIKWCKFLERQQDKFCSSFKDLFLLHLEFKGLKKQYSLNKRSLNISMTPPSDFKEQMAQSLIETQFNNYTTLNNEEEFSKTFLMRKFLKWTDDELKENFEGFVQDKKMIPKEDDGY